MTTGVDLVRLQRILEELERLHDRCERQLLRSEELMGAVTAADAELRALLPEDSDAFRLFDRGLRQTAEYWRNTISGYVAGVDCNNVERRIELVRQILLEIEPGFLREHRAAPSQFYFQEGEVYQARQALLRLLRRARKSLDIADPYLDPMVFDFLEALDEPPVVRLLTGVRKSLFASQFHLLRGRGMVMEARGNDANHDRFLIIDGVEAWQMGASINGLGKKASMVNKITDPERGRMIEDFNTWWASGTPL